MGKLIRDGKVAVIISPGFGAGFSSWNGELDGGDELLFDQTIALAVESEDMPAAFKRAEEICPGGYWGCGELELDWVNEGEFFYLHEYDGSEWIVRQSDMKVA